MPKCRIQSTDIDKESSKEESPRETGDLSRECGLTVMEDKQHQHWMAIANDTMEINSAASSISAEIKACTIIRLKATSPPTTTL